jgi:hypothetical protein
LPCNRRPAAVPVARCRLRSAQSGQCGMTGADRDDEQQEVGAQQGVSQQQGEAQAGRIRGSRVRRQPHSSRHMQQPEVSNVKKASIRAAPRPRWRVRIGRVSFFLKHGVRHAGSGAAVRRGPLAALQEGENAGRSRPLKRMVHCQEYAAPRRPGNRDARAGDVFSPAERRPGAVVRPSRRTRPGRV